MERGVIRNREFASRIRDFSGLRFGNITPTDLDGMIEYRDRCFVFYESKFNGFEMKYGQRLAFERLVDNLNKPSVLFATEYSNEDGDIDFANTVVKKFYFEGKWYFENHDTLYIATKNFFDKYG